MVRFVGYWKFEYDISMATAKSYSSTYAGISSAAGGGLGESTQE
jgi:hypothetical protein